jgi:hypothetical protein
LASNPHLTTMPTMTMPTMPILGLTAIFRTGTHSSSLTLSSTKGAVPAELAGLKHAMSIRLDFLEIGEASRYDTAIDPGTSQKCIYSALTPDHANSGHT